MWLNTFDDLMHISTFDDLMHIRDEFLSPPGGVGSNLTSGTSEVRRYKLESIF